MRGAGLERRAYKRVSIRPQAVQHHRLVLLLRSIPLHWDNINEINNNKLNGSTSRYIAGAVTEHDKDERTFSARVAAKGIVSKCAADWTKS